VDLVHRYVHRGFVFMWFARTVALGQIPHLEWEIEGYGTYCGRFRWTNR